MKKKKISQCHIGIRVETPSKGFALLRCRRSFIHEGGNKYLIYTYLCIINSFFIIIFIFLRHFAYEKHVAFVTTVDGNVLVSTM
jgi:hypothetical protein